MKAVRFLFLMVILGLAQNSVAQIVYLDPTSKDNYQRAQVIAREGTKIGLPHINTFRDNLMREKGVMNYYDERDGKAIMIRQLVQQEINRRERIAIDYVEAENKAAQIRAQQPAAPVATQPPAIKAIPQMSQVQVLSSGSGTNVVKKYVDQNGNPIPVDENGNPIIPTAAGAVPAQAAQSFPEGFFAPPAAAVGGGGGGGGIPQAAGPTPEQLAASAAAQEKQRKEAEKAAKQARLKEATEDARNRRIETRDRLKERIKDL